MNIKVNNIIKEHSWWIITLLLVGMFSCTNFSNKAQEPLFAAPGNMAELKSRIEQLRSEYAPYLRSLPEKSKLRPKVSLNGEWKFIFEIKDPPKVDAPPPSAPEWYSENFDDTGWLLTTVPEWRYRTVGHDNLYERKVDKVTITGERRNTSQICWYRRKFTVNKPSGGKRAWLCFDGVDWEAEVYFNGEFLGTHSVYYEPFRFDVTEKLKKGENTLAVRVIDGKVFGEPVWGWTPLPDIRAEQQRYTPDPSESIKGNLTLGYHAATGFGIWRDVYIEETGPLRVDAIFVRNDLSNEKARIRVEMNASEAVGLPMKVVIMPENFEGKKYKATFNPEFSVGNSVHEISVPMPGAKVWSPEKPYLYRCRVFAGDDNLDVLFGCRSFTIVHRQQGKITPAYSGENNLGENPPEGMLMLNGKPCYLRGTNVQGFNAYAYWGQREKLIDAILLLKAGYFNSFRSCQHVQMPEVREMLDRLGIMSQQDQGAGSSYEPKLPVGIREPHYLKASKALTRITYNNPGVILLSLGNEGDWPTDHVVREGLKVDSQRIYVPISGRATHSRKPWGLPEPLRKNAIDDGHPYSGWYGKIIPQTWNYSKERYKGDGDRMVTMGEFGAEALDAYETMKTYPPQFAPPPPNEDTLWAACQVEKHDVRQLIGFGKKPSYLDEYIEASQNYQEALLADCIIQMRLMPQNVAGYFHFHFMDVIPVFWPKSIVSHDHRPKKAYYQIAQINQPIVVLPKFSGKRPEEMKLWVCNDLTSGLDNALVEWTVKRDEEVLIYGEQKVNVAPVGITAVTNVDLKPVTWKHPDCHLQFVLKNSEGKVVSQYRRHLRCVPTQLLDKEISDKIDDPFCDQ
jgi:beta-mannosidase